MGGIFALVYLAGFLGFGLWAVRAIDLFGGVTAFKEEVTKDEDQEVSDNAFKWVILLGLLMWPIALLGVFISNMNNNNK